MQNVFEKLSNRIQDWRKEVKSLLEQKSESVISQVTVAQVFGGMRGIISLVCDTSRVPQDKGLIIREIPLAKLIDKTPEEVFYLLLTGELPNKEEAEDFSNEIKKRKIVPAYVWDVLKAMPKDSHPMTMLDTAVLVMQKESVFAKEYEKGIRKEDYWKYTLEDSLNLVARIPAIAAAIYRMRFDKGNIINPAPEMDITGDYVHMLGFSENNEGFKDLMRLYLVAHCDHEGGNVSALTTQTINSALSDVYYSISGGFNGLAGPLHGLANQESLKWILETMEKFAGVPTKEQLVKIVWDTLNAGKVIPGYGHAVLRVVDPRFEAFLNFGKKHFPDDPVFKTVALLFEVVPEELKKMPKIKNPWPNVDAASGSMLYHYGLKEFSYYTVLFAVSRTLGLTSQAVVNRAMLSPIIRPKSVTTKNIKNMIS